MKENYKTSLTFQIFTKTGATIFWHLISQTDMFPNCTENASTKDREYLMQLLEPSTARRDEIVDNNYGDLGRPTSNVEKEELQKL